MLKSYEPGRLPGIEKQLFTPERVEREWGKYGQYKPGDLIFIEVGKRDNGGRTYIVSRNNSAEGLWGHYLVSNVKDEAEDIV